MTAFLVNAPRWLFLATLVYAPWAYGCTRPWTIEILDVALLAVVVLWLAGCAVRRMRPYMPWPLGVAVLFLLAQGWGMIGNAQASYDRVALVFNTLKQWVPFAPGVIDRADAVPMMIRLTALLGALLFAVDLSWRHTWRTRLWWTMGLTGVSLVACGLGMRIFGYHISSYYAPDEIGWLSFAFYLYHGNAAAFINLILPMVGGLAALAFLQPKAQFAEFRRAFWLPGLLICIAGAVAAASKGGMVISALLLIGMTAWFVRVSAERGVFQLSRGQLAMLIGGFVLVLGAMAALNGNTAADRWSRFDAAHAETARSRILVDQVCFHMMGDSNFFGFGPGNFAIAFPHYTGYLGTALAGVWNFAHDDYLQTIVEWGFIGAVIWAVVLFGGLWTGWRTLRSTPLGLPDTALLTMALLAVAGVAVHAAFDFPFQIASLQLYAVTLLGLCWGSPLFAGTGMPNRRRRA